MRIALGMLTAGALLLASAPAAAKIENPSVWASVKGPRGEAIRRWARKVARRKLASCARGDVSATISFSVSPKGRVKATVAGTKLGKKQRRIRRCLAKRLRRLRLPPGKGVVKVRLRVRWLSKRSPKRRAALRRKLTKAGVLGLLVSGKGSRIGSVFGGSSKFKGSLGGLLGSSRGAVRVGGNGRGGRGRGVGTIGLSWKRRAELRKKRRERAKSARKELSAKALKLPGRRSKRAPWLRPVERSPLFGHGRRSGINVGRDAALLLLTVYKLAKPVKGKEHFERSSRYALFDRAGLRGVVKLPVERHRWRGLDGQNRVYVATRQGQLYRADAAEAFAGRFRKLAKVDKVRRWTIAGKLIAAKRDKDALLSTDGGKTFAPLKLPAGSTAVRDLELRPDGLIALQVDTAKGKVLYLRRGAEPWRRSSFQPTTLYRRAGSWLYASHFCGNAVLAADGKRWVRRSRLPSIHDWRRLARVRSIRGRGYASKGASQATPSPTAKGDDVITASEPAPCRPSGRGAAGMGLLGRVRGGSGPTGCNRGIKQQAYCVRGSADGLPRSSLFAIYPLADQRRTLLAIDHTTATLSRTKLPPTCKAPAALRPLSGAMLLLCREATTKTRVFISDQRFRWHDQGTFAAPPSELRQAQVAQDGTVVLQACDFDNRRAKAEGNGYLCSTAWVRRPVALARGAKAWREVRQRDMLAYRPLTGGRVLAIDRGDDRGATIQLYVDDGKHTRRFGPKLTPPRNLANVIVDGRTVRLVSRYHRQQIVLRNGELANWPKL